MALASFAPAYCLDDLAIVCTISPKESAVPIYVGNLAFTTTDHDLRQLCEPYGVVDEIRVIMDRDTGRSKGFGFIEMPAAPRRQPPLPDSTARSVRAVPSRSMQRSRVPRAGSPADPGGKSRVCKTAPLRGGRCCGGRGLQATRGSAQPHTTMCMRWSTAPHASLRLTTLPLPDAVRRRGGGEERSPGTPGSRHRPPAWPLRTDLETATRLARGATRPHSPRRSTEWLCAFLLETSRMT